MGLGLFEASPFAMAPCMQLGGHQVGEEFLQLRFGQKKSTKQRLWKESSEGREEGKWMVRPSNPLTLSQQKHLGPWGGAVCPDLLGGSRPVCDNRDIRGCQEKQRKEQSGCCSRTTPGLQEDMWAIKSPCSGNRDRGRNRLKLRFEGCFMTSDLAQDNPEGKPEKIAPKHSSGRATVKCGLSWKGTEGTEDKYMEAVPPTPLCPGPGSNHS